jgi:hypothetical protein
MTAAAEDRVNIAFRLTADTKCPTNTAAALQPKLSVGMMYKAHVAKQVNVSICKTCFQTKLTVCW